MKTSILFCLAILLIAGCVAQAPDEEGFFSIEAPEYTPAVLIEGEKASFRENEDLRLSLNAEPPTELNGEWQVSLQIEAFRDLKDVSLIFAVYPETACQIEIDSIEGLDIPTSGYERRSSMLIDLEKGVKARVVYKFSACPWEREWMLLRVSAELNYDGIFFVFDDLNLVLSEGDGFVYYHSTPWPTPAVEGIHPVITPLTVQTTTPEYLVTPGVTVMPPTPSLPPTETTVPVTPVFYP